MPPAARVGDMHTCPMVTVLVPHVGGPILPPGCPTVLIGCMPAACMGDMATCVGPPDSIIKGSATVFIGNKPAARIGDNTAHGGVIVVGCPTVLIGDAGSGGGGGGAGGGAGGAGASGGGGGSTSQAAAAAMATQGLADTQPAPADQSGPLEPEESPEKKTWIGVKLKDFNDKPVCDQDFEITLEGGQKLSGRTDSEGYARFEDVDPDQGEVAFTKISEDDETAASAEGTKTDDRAEGDQQVESTSDTQVDDDGDDGKWPDDFV